MGALEEAVRSALGAEGRQLTAMCDFGNYLAFCYTKRPLLDLLVVHKKTPVEGEVELYDAEQVTLHEVEVFEPVACKLLEALGEWVYGAVLTRNPYVKGIAIGPTMTLEDVVAYYVKGGEVGAWLEHFLAPSAVLAEVPTVNLDVVARGGALAEEKGRVDALRSKRRLCAGATPQQ